MILQFLIDQGTLHVMSCQLEHLVTLDEIQWIMLLSIRSILPDEQTHVFHKASKFPDCVALEIGKRSIRVLLHLQVYIKFKLCWIPFESKHGVVINSMVYDPLHDVFSWL